MITPDFHESLRIVLLCMMLIVFSPIFYILIKEQIEAWRNLKFTVSDVFTTIGGLLFAIADIAIISILMMLGLGFTFTWF